MSADRCRWCGSSFVPYRGVCLICGQPRPDPDPVRPDREDCIMTTTTTTITGTAAELDAIMRDLDATSAAWVAAGYGYGTPEDEAREAVFVRLHAWNEAREGGRS